METTQQTVETKVKKSNVSNSQTGLIISLPVLHEGKDSGKTLSIDTDNFSKSIGEILKTNAEKLEVKLNGVTVSIPSGKTKDGIERFFAAVKGFAGAIYKDCEQDGTPSDKSHLALISSLLKSGFEFADLKRVSVTTGINIRVNNRMAKLNLSKTVTKEMKQNRVWIAETGTAKELNKMVKEQGIGAAFKRLEELKALKQDAGIKLLNN